MLILRRKKNESLLIGDNIRITIIECAGDGVRLAIDAPKSVPIVRGAVLERNGGMRPGCLAPPPRKKARTYRDQVFRWNDDRERAVRIMKQVIDRLERSGAGGEAKVLRTQLDRIVPAFWEEDLAAP